MFEMARRTLKPSMSRQHHPAIRHGSAPAPQPHPPPRRGAPLSQLAAALSANGTRPLYEGGERVVSSGAARHPWSPPPGFSGGERMGAFWTGGQRSEGRGVWTASGALAGQGESRGRVCGRRRREGPGRAERKREEGGEGRASEKCVCFLYTSQTPGSQAAKNAQKKTLVQYHAFNYTWNGMSSSGKEQHSPSSSWGCLKWQEGDPGPARSL